MTPSRLVLVVGKLTIILAAADCRREPAEGRDEPVPLAVHCVQEKRGAVDATQTLRGRIAAPPGGDLPVASQVAGRVVEVLVHEGDRVQAGAIVALIDEGASRDASREADAALAQAKIGAANAQATLERTRQLVGRGIAARQELDDAVARAEQSRAGVSAAVAAADLARRTLGRVQVRSSFGGIVTRVWRGSGALVDGTAATPVVQLAAPELAELHADATDRQLLDIAPGQTVRVIPAPGGEPLVGTVRARSVALEPSTGLGLVRIAIDAKTPPMLGVFAIATVATGRRDGVLLIPATAIRGAVADGAEVVVCKDGKASVRKVQVGWRDDEHVEIVEGLAEGERVAVDHVLGVETGSPIVDAP